VLDEATEGLAPLIRAEIWAVLAKLKQEGLAQIVIDKNVGALLKLADRHFVMEKGRVVWQGDSAQLRNESAIVQQYMGVS
jgi:branched-chain amino acid transport system ATP-binding protein